MAGCAPEQLPKPLIGATYLNATATWRSGYATVCKTVYSGSIPDVASINSFNGLRLGLKAASEHQQVAYQPSGKGISGHASWLSLAGGRSNARVGPAAESLWWIGAT